MRVGGSLARGTTRSDPSARASCAPLLDRYPNLYIDISFGHADFQVAGFEVLAATRERAAAFLTRYAQRVMFGGDLVIVSSTEDEFVEDTLRSYMQLLESERFRFFLRPERPMRGLALSPTTLRAIYRDSALDFLRLRQRGVEPAP